MKTIKRYFQHRLKKSVKVDVYGEMVRKPKGYVVLTSSRKKSIDPVYHLVIGHGVQMHFNGKDIEVVDVKETTVVTVTKKIKIIS